MGSRGILGAVKEALPGYSHPRRDGAAWAVRNAFLLAIRDRAREVLDDLAGRPFALYEAVRPLEDLVGYGDARYWSGAHRLDRPMMEALQAWAQQWNLPPWLIGVAQGTLWRWRTKPAWRQRREWELPAFVNAAPVPPEDRAFLTFNPRRGIRRSEMRRRLADYLDRIDRLARSRGWQPWREPRNLEKAAEWVVQHRVLGRTLERVAGDAGVSVVTVSSAIRRLSPLLGYPARRRGRPRSI